MDITTKTGAIFIQGGPNVRINDGTSGPMPQIAKVDPADPASPAGGGPKGTPPVIPTGGGKIDKPGKVDDVNISAMAADEKTGPAAKAGDDKGAKKPDTWVKDHPDDIKAALKAQRELLLAKQAELKTWDDKAKANFKMYFGSTDDGAKKLVQDRIQSELDLNAKMKPENFVQSAKDDNSLYAYVYPDDASHKIYLAPAFERAPLTGEDSKAGTLSHEMSHFQDVGKTSENLAWYDLYDRFTDTGGTQDHVYGASGARQLAKDNPYNALRNADNFEYYVEGAKP
jgi:hypothetical protein